MSQDKYGLDMYGRYVERDGQCYAIEPYPFWRPFSPWTIWLHIFARIEILKWYWATRHQRELWKY